MTRKQKIATAVTGLFVLGVLPGAIMNLVQPPILVEMAGTLGVTTSLMSLVGTWKVLGITALLVPGFPRIREWAYAGFVFDLTGAAFLHGAAGDYAGVPAPLVLAGIGFASYLLRRNAMNETEAGRAALVPA
jgi:hypothetical protein